MWVQKLTLNMYYIKQATSNVAFRWYFLNLPPAVGDSELPFSDWVDKPPANTTYSIHNFIVVY